MLLRLPDLQVELQLMIVDHLLSDDHGIKDDDREYDEKGNPNRRKDKTRDRMVASHKSLLHWSNTCAQFRKFLIPYIFHSITLRNDETSGSSVHSVAVHEVYSRCVRELEFIGSALGTARKDEPRYSDVEGILPKNVEHLLANLKYFPNLEKLSVEFAYNFPDWGEWKSGVNPAAAVEDDHEVRCSEEREAWRALMKRVWEAICRNEQPVIKHLEIVRLGHKKVSTFNTTAFHKFLGSLEIFTISLWGGDNGAGWRTITCQEYTALASNLDLYFFDHMSSLTSLEFKVPKEGTLGLEDGYRESHLPLRKEHMPLLRSVRIEGIFIRHALADLLTGHIKTLEEVILRNCYAEFRFRSGKYDMHWHQLFDAVSFAVESAKDTKLRSFEVSSDASLPLTSDVFEDPWVWEEEEIDREAELKKAEELLTSDHRRRLFAHGTLDTKYGILDENGWENMKSLMEGKDQAAWERLMGLIMEN